MRLARLAVALLAGGFALAVHPATTTTTFSVSVSVPGTCSVNAATLDFGSYSGAADVDSSSTLNVNCTTGVNYAVSLNKGIHGPNITTRRMKHGTTTATLNYGLFTAADRLTTWGDGTVGTQTVPGTGTGADVAHSVFGRVPSGQAVTTGGYADSITVTVTF